MVSSHGDIDGVVCVFKDLYCRLTTLESESQLVARLASFVDPCILTRELRRRVIWDPAAMMLRNLSKIKPGAVKQSFLQYYSSSAGNSKALESGNPEEDKTLEKSSTIFPSLSNLANKDKHKPITAACTKDTDLKSIGSNSKPKTPTAYSTSNLPPPPTTCCGSRCPNCVWIDYAEELCELLKDGTTVAQEEMLKSVEDRNMRAYLLMEIKLLRK